jgi:hypothetical protein
MFIIIVPTILSYPLIGFIVLIGGAFLKGSETISK